MWSSQVKSYGLDPSQFRITSLRRHLGTRVFHLMCYDPESNNHPLDGMTNYNNKSVGMVMGPGCILERCRKRGKIEGDVGLATELCRVVDAFCALLATKVDGAPTKPARAFVADRSSFAICTTTQHSNHSNRSNTTQHNTRRKRRKNSGRFLTRVSHP